MNEDITFFVCGTPSDKRGFEYAASNNRRLPGEPSSYLDVFDPKTMDRGRTFLTTSIKENGDPYGLIVVYQKINPNDVSASRGAYIGVGALVSRGLTLDQMISIFFCIMEIHGKLAVLRSDNNTFPRGFDLKEYSFGSLNTDLPASFILDEFGRNVYQTMPMPKSEKAVFNEVREKRPHRTEATYCFALETASIIAGMEKQTLQLRENLSASKEAASKREKELEEKIRELEKRLGDEKRSGIVLTHTNKLEPGSVDKDRSRSRSPHPRSNGGRQSHTVSQYVARRSLQSHQNTIQPRRRFETFLSNLLALGQTRMSSRGSWVLEKAILGVALISIIFMLIMVWIIITKSLPRETITTLDDHGAISRSEHRERTEEERVPPEKEGNGTKKMKEESSIVEEREKALSPEPENMNDRD